MTNFVSRVRQLADDWAAKRGHPIKVSARVPTRPDAAYGWGLDAYGWAISGLVDVISPANRWATSDFGIFIEDWRHLIDGEAASVTHSNVDRQVVMGFVVKADDGEEPVEILGSWTSGLSHAEEPGSKRALLFTAHVDNSGTLPDLTAVTYGGQAMTRIGSNNIYALEIANSACIAAYVLDEAGIAAASGSSFSPTWDNSPDYVGYTSVFVSNVDQDDPIREYDSNTTTANGSPGTLATGLLGGIGGDLSVVAGTCGNTGNYFVDGNFTEAIELTMASGDGVVGYKSNTSSVIIAPSLDQNIQASASLVSRPCDEGMHRAFTAQYLHRGADQIHWFNHMQAPKQQTIDAATIEAAIAKSRRHILTWPDTVAPPSPGCS